VITIASPPEQKWAEIVADLEKLAEFNLERDGADKRPDTPSLAAAGLTAADLTRLGGRLSTEDLLSLSLTEIESKPVFEYGRAKATISSFKTRRRVNRRPHS
jgi:chromosome segregation protein